MTTPLQRKSIHAREETDRGDQYASSGFDDTAAKPSKTVDQSGPSSNPLKWPALLYHFSMAVFYALLLYHTTVEMKDSYIFMDHIGMIPEYGGLFKYLTYINIFLQLGFFSLQLVTDLTPKSAAKTKLQSLCDLFFTSITFPTALFITVMFWGVYAVDRGLTYYDPADTIVPQYLNHFWHTTIVVWVVFETLICFHRYPTTGTGAAVNFAFNAAYMSWVVWIFLKTDFWVYPVLEVLPLPYRVAFFAFWMSLCLVMCFLGKVIAQLRWGPTSYLT